MQHNRTLYVSDLDGTLLNSQSRVSDESIEILNDMITNHGAMFTVATARTPATVVPMLQEVKLSLPAIVMTGAAMWNIHSQSYNHVCQMPAEKVAAIYNIFVENGIAPFVYFTRENTLEVHHAGTLNRREAIFIEERNKSPFKHFTLKEEHPAISDAVLIFAINDFDILYKIYTQIRSEVECEAVCYKDIFNPKTGFLEVFESNTSKATAIKTLAQEIDANRIVVFGDNLNDIPMMEIATHSCAMENAFPEVKAIATETIGYNHQHSVAKWIANDIKNR